MSEVREGVFDRDVICFGARMDPTHVCRNQWGVRHAANDRRFLTVDHVKEHGMMGHRAPSDSAHLVAMCWEMNVGVPSKEVRQAERAYLTKLYPDQWPGAKRAPVSWPDGVDPSEVPELALIASSLETQIP